MKESSTIDTAQFTYCVVPEGFRLRLKLGNETRFCNYTIHTSLNTDCRVALSGKKSEIAIIGFCIDAFGEIPRQNLASHIAATVGSFAELLAFENRLAGKYVLLFYSHYEGCCVLGDATGSIQVNYRQETPSAISSLPLLLFQTEKSPICSQEYLAIRRAGDISQAMPNDLTPYAQVRTLLPNHYLLMDTAQVSRFAARHEGGCLTAHEAAVRTIPLVNNIARQMAETYPLVCPITGGRDSRTVLAFLHAQQPHIRCYTIQHREMDAYTTDLCIAQRVMERMALPYSIITDEEVPLELYRELDALLGEGNYSHRTAMIAYTVHKNYLGKGIINGDIIGQIGKASLHRGIPQRWMRTRYFRCKLHNYSAKSLRHIKAWQVSTRQEKEVEICDLFSWESRLGRWAAQENQIYDLLAVPYLNIYNNRGIIGLWTCVPRMERKTAAIQCEILREIAPELLEVPFERPKSILERIAKSNDFAYYIATFMKYYVECHAFHIDKRKGVTRR